MKFHRLVRHNDVQKSRPARGAWIEILIRPVSKVLLRCRAPHGARGLKCLACRDDASFYVSRPARGAWIEIGCQGAL